MADTWIATLNNGKVFREESPELVGERSAWRELESLCKRDGYKIERVAACLGSQVITMESGENPLLCGQALEKHIDLVTGQHINIRYRWICCQGETTWTWCITNGFSSWTQEMPALAEVRMPLPPRPVEVSHCLHCGSCCRDWVGEDPGLTCDHLVMENGRSRSGKWESLESPEVNRGECRNLYTLAQSPSLPDCCGYIIFWKKFGLVERNEDGRWRPTI